MCSQEGGVVAGHQKTKNPRALYVRGREGICAPERNRTSDTGLRRAVLYPLSY